MCSNLKAQGQKIYPLAISVKLFFFPPTGPSSKLRFLKVWFRAEIFSNFVLLFNIIPKSERVNFYYVAGLFPRWALGQCKDDPKRIKGVVGVR